MLFVGQKIQLKNNEKFERLKYLASFLVKIACYLIFPQLFKNSVEPLSIFTRLKF